MSSEGSLHRSRIDVSSLSSHSRRGEGTFCYLHLSGTAGMSLVSVGAAYGDKRCFTHLGFCACCWGKIISKVFSEEYVEPPLLLQLLQYLSRPEAHGMRTFPNQSACWWWVLLLVLSTCLSVSGWMREVLGYEFRAPFWTGPLAVTTFILLLLPLSLSKLLFRVPIFIRR